MDKTQIETFLTGDDLIMSGPTGLHRLYLPESSLSRVWTHTLGFAANNRHSVPGAYAARAVAKVYATNCT